MANYLNSETPLLTADEEVELAKQIEAGAQAGSRIEHGQDRPGDQQVVKRARDARRRFVEANIGLVISIAAKTRVPARVDRDDLVQDGIVGLDHAITKFDWRRGHKFSTYATWWIRQAIQRGLENTATTVRIPAHRTAELRAALAHDMGDSASLSPALTSIVAMIDLESLDRPIGGDATTLADLTPDDHKGPDAMVDTLLDRWAVHRLLGELDGTTATALVARFGLDGDKPATFSEIGESLGVSAEAVRRRIQRALMRLRPSAERLTSPHLSCRAPLVPA